jgi:hypothetical protein
VPATGADSDRSTTLWLILLFVLALALRVGWVIRQPSDDASIDRLPDQREYLTLARNLRDASGLKFFDERFAQDVYAYRTPGYPVFVASFAANIRAVRLAQAALDASVVFATYLLARRWLAPRASLLAAGLVAVNPFLIYFCGLVLSETLFVAMLAWGMALIVLAGDAARLGIRPAFAAILRIAGAMLLVLSIQVRPSALLLPALLVAAVAGMNWEHDRPYQWRRAGAALLFMLVLTGVSLWPWSQRNAEVLGQRVWTTTNGGITAYDGFNPNADGSSNQRFVREMPELAGMSETRRSDYLSRLARKYAIEHPLRALWLAVVKIGRTWSPIPLSREYGGKSLYVAVGLLFSLPLDGLALIGLFRSRVLPRPAKLFLLLPALYFTAVHATSVGSLRYRIPAEVPISVIAASALCGGRVRFSGPVTEKLGITSPLKRTLPRTLPG